eukprot:4136630-Ditylum_brightwellii.AAC.1
MFVAHLVEEADTADEKVSTSSAFESSIQDAAASHVATGGISPEISLPQTAAAASGTSPLSQTTSGRKKRGRPRLSGEEKAYRKRLQQEAG